MKIFRYHWKLGLKIIKTCFNDFGLRYVRKSPARLSQCVSIRFQPRFWRVVFSLIFVVTSTVTWIPTQPVSYTHLDVYKRQVCYCVNTVLDINGQNMVFIFYFVFLFVVIIWFLFQMLIMWFIFERLFPFNKIGEIKFSSVSVCAFTLQKQQFAANNKSLLCTMPDNQWLT